MEREYSIDCRRRYRSVSREFILDIKKKLENREYMESAVEGAADRIASAAQKMNLSLILLEERKAA